MNHEANVGGRGSQARAASWPAPPVADTVYFYLYDVAELDHIRLLGREVLPQLN
jgi:hypothetical protein